MPFPKGVAQELIGFLAFFECLILDMTFGVSLLKGIDMKYGNEVRIHGTFIARIRNLRQMHFTRSGTFGLAVTAAGGALLGISFLYAYQLFQVYMNLANNSSGAGTQFVGSLNALLEALVPVMILAIMGWIGSIFLLRGVDFMKVDRGVGLVTFKVDKSVGLVGDPEGQVGVVTGVETMSRKKKSDDQALELAPVPEQQS
jgi:hypothetical protein